MKTKAIVTSIVAVVAVAIGITTLVLINQPAAQAPAVEQTQAAQTAPEAEVSFTAEAGKSILDQLKTKATVEVKDSTLGPYVNAVNGKVGAADNKYWSYYVDGQLGQVGAAEYITKGGEKVDWKFE